MAAGSTYTPLYTYTAGATVASIDFSGITQSYNDLVISCSLRGTASATTVDLLMRTNGNSGNVYDGLRYAVLNGSVVTGRYNNSSFAAPLGAMNAATSPANIFSTHEININRYSDTNFFKTSIARSGSAYNTSGGGGIDLVLNSYFLTTAVTQLTFLPSSGSFDVGSTITIFGIAAA